MILFYLLWMKYTTFKQCEIEFWTRKIIVPTHSYLAPNNSQKVLPKKKQRKKFIDSFSKLLSIELPTCEIFCLLSQPLSCYLPKLKLRCILHT